MPKPPLFSNRKTQSLAITAAMGLLLAVSLGAAFAVSGGDSALPGHGAGAQGETRRLDFDGLAMDLPGSWSAIKGDRSRDGMTQVAVFARNDSPARRLLVAKVSVPRPQPPLAVMQGVLRQLVKGESRQVAQPLVGQDADKAWGRYIGISRAQSPQAAEGIREHFLYVLTHNGSDYWVLYMTDLADPATPLSPQLRANAQAFGPIVQSVRFTPAPGSQDSPGSQNSPRSQDTPASPDAP